MTHILVASRHLFTPFGRARHQGVRNALSAAGTTRSRQSPAVALVAPAFLVLVAKTRHDAYAQATTPLSALSGFIGNTHL
jgi:hypothetical protein